MKTISYYYSTNNEVKIKQVLEQPMFQPLIDYLFDHQSERIILRKLKAEFPKAEKLEQLLEDLIELQLIERTERNYRLAFPIFDYQQLATTTEKKVETINLTILSQCAAEHQAAFLGEVLWSQLFSNETNYFFGIREANTQQAFYRKMVLKNESICFTSIYQEETTALSLPQYFESSERERGRGEYQRLLALIGDVDPEYFLSQAKRVVKQAIKNRSVATKPNIFQESLLLADVIEVSDDAKLALKQPVVTEELMEKLPIELKTSFLKEIDKLSDSSLEPNQRVAKKMYLFATILKKLNKTELSYINI